ncbi:helix-turn-helix domain-containing protein [Wolbachia endosymbiont of Drosophila mauritiana]|nr:helix-turn-helix domain-containing protein [Wolbachia endosymbiont of Drosophila mauritiana]QCB64071.1 helix-turn-helix domain-containing protein [Wolbachia endosymbiont of Drosophila mauritiana]TGB07845.1 helix-turn-helix domain-containing protein [Wolbachia endosymbiont of Drosophila mauritiana]
MENSRLMRGHTQIELASKIGLTYQEVNSYENGYSSIPIEVLYVIARVLSVDVVDLLPEPVIVREDSYEDEEIPYLTKIYENQKLGKIVPSLVRFVHISEKINQEEARLEVAKNLVKEGVSVDIISQATGLSIYEYNDTRKEVCTDSIYYRVGQRIREWRLIRRYTQKDLADKVDLTLKEIHEYEKGYTAISFDKLYEIARELSVNIKVLLSETRESKEENKLLSLIKALLPKITECEDENSKKLLSLMDEYREDENQESLDALVKSLSEDMKSGKEKVKKAEKIRVAKNLSKADVSIDIILRASGLTVGELGECEN